MTDRVPWLLAFFCLVIPILPSYIVAPGPLKGNGSPARFLTFLLTALAILSLLRVRRDIFRHNLMPGIIVLLIYGFAWLLVWGVGASEIFATETGGGQNTYGIGFGVADRNFDDVEVARSRFPIVLIQAVGISLYAALRVKTCRQLSVVLGAFAIGLTFNSAVVLLQTVGIDLHLLFSPPGFVYNTTRDGNLITATGAERLGVNRASGTSAHPIEFAVLAAIAVPLLIYFVRFGKSGMTRQVAALAAIVVLVSIPMAVSRSGVIVLATVMVIIVWNFKARMVITALACSAIALLVEYILYPQVFYSLWNTIAGSAEDESVLVRIERYGWVSQTFRANRLFGLGPGSYSVILDNQWLQDLVAGGGVGLAAAISLAVGGIASGTAGLRSSETLIDRNQTNTILAMFIGLLVSSFTFDLQGFQQATFSYFLLFGLLASKWVIRYESNPKSSMPPLGGCDH